MKADTGKPDRGWSKKEEVRGKRERERERRDRVYISCSVHV
jgi:hypothetical protein